MFDLNISMRVRSDQDFLELRKHINSYRHRFPMFIHDINKIEHMIEAHIQNFSLAGVHYRQTKKRVYLEKAQYELDRINEIISLVDKIELMALLART